MAKPLLEPRYHQLSRPRSLLVCRKSPATFLWGCAAWPGFGSLDIRIRHNLQSWGPAFEVMLESGGGKQFPALL